LYAGLDLRILLRRLTDRPLAPSDLDEDLRWDDRRLDRWDEVYPCLP
jgi:hypothetical protein